MNDLSGPRRFSTASAILPPKVDDGLKASPYGGTADAGEVESLLSQGIIQEYTSVGRESKLLFKYSLPLTLTYLLQVCFPLSTMMFSLEFYRKGIINADLCRVLFVIVVYLFSRYYFRCRASGHG
jgi:hypothetical protein